MITVSSKGLPRIVPGSEDEKMQRAALDAGTNERIAELLSFLVRNKLPFTHINTFPALGTIVGTVPAEALRTIRKSIKGKAILADMTDVRIHRID